MKKASLELSVNSIVVFIISIIIFGFGIFLLFSIFSKAPSLDVPDFCNNILKNDIEQNQIFSICPKTLDLNKKELLNGFKVSYVYLNLDDNDKKVNIFLDNSGDNSNFDIVSLPITVKSGEYSSGEFLLRLKKDSEVKQEYVLKINLCNVNSDTDDCSGILESKVLLLNVK